jgi:hypothetical protein
MGANDELKNFVRLGDVLKIARDRGLQDHAALSLYRKWLTSVQDRVEKVDTPVSRIKLEITCAEVYLEIDLPEEAAECFRDAITEARQERLGAIILDLERALETVVR